MIKKLAILFVILIIAGVSPLSAAEGFTLGSCDHKIAGSNGYGSDSAGEISAALFIPSSKLRSLAGNGISRVDVGLISRINVRDMTVWVRKTLNGDNLASAYVERGILGWNEVNFSDPYIIEENCPGLYVGFTYSNTGSSHPVSFIGESGDYTSWFRSKAGAEWEDMTSKGALSLEVIVTGNNLPQYDLSLLSCNVYPDLSGDGDRYIVSGTVANLAMKAINGFTLKVSDSVSEGPEQEVALQILPGEEVPFSVSYPAGFDLSGEVSVDITRLADGQDADPVNNSLVTLVAYPRNVLFEEFTTEQCVNCPAAAEMVNDVMSRHNHYNGRVVSVCHHSGFGTDDFTRECDNDLLWMYDMGGLAFAPAAMFDRQPIFKRGLNLDRFEPIVALRSEKDIEECIEEAMKIVPHAMVAINVLSSDESSATVEVKVITDNEFSLTSPNLTFYMTQDNVKAIHQEGATGKYIHNHLIRFDNGGWGEPIELEENSYSKVFNVELDPEWKREDLGFVAFLAERDEENVANNVVENSAFAPLVAKPSGNTAVSEINTGDAVPVAQYDIHGRRISGNHEGLSIVIMSDGSVKKIFNK